MERKDAMDWEGAPLGSLLSHLTDCHKAILDRSLPHIAELITAIGGDESCEPCQDIAGGFKEFCALLKNHVQTEDGSVFGLIHSLESAERLHVFHCRSIARPIGVMVREHATIFTALDDLRGIAASYPAGTGPADAVLNLQRALCELESELRACSHKEEQIAYPRAIAREAHLAGLGDNPPR